MSKAKGKGKANGASSAQQDSVLAMQQRARAIASANSASSAQSNATVYWADASSSKRMPGGGIHRIGYDGASFEKVYNEMFLADDAPSAELELSKPLATYKSHGVFNPAVAPRQEANGVASEDVSLKQEDVELIVDEFELSTHEAETALQRAGGDVAKALRHLSGPVSLPTPTSLANGRVTVPASIPA